MPRGQAHITCSVLPQVIEAHYLFGVDYDNIDIVIHPQSIIHSMVETADSSVLAQVRLMPSLIAFQLMRVQGFTWEQDTHHAVRQQGQRLCCMGMNTGSPPDHSGCLEAAGGDGAAMYALPSVNSLSLPVLHDCLVRRAWGWGHCSTPKLRLCRQVQIATSARCTCCSAALLSSICRLTA